MERVVKRLEGVSHDSAYYIALAQKCLDNHGKIIDPGAITDKANDFSKNYFEHNPHFYINPTEKLCMQALVGQGDKVATVLGSGDFALDAVYQGASRVDTFDINEYQEALASIKIASAGLMSYQDYMNFYSDPLSAKYLDPFLFKKVQKSADNHDSFSFLSALMAVKRMDDMSLKRNKVYQLIKDIAARKKRGVSLSSTEYEFIMFLMSFGIDINDYLDLSDIQLYYFISFISNDIVCHVYDIIMGQEYKPVSGAYNEDKTSFSKMQGLLESVPISFTPGNITTLNGFGGTGYDSIYLSNIPEYFNETQFLQTFPNLMGLLQDDGMIGYVVQNMSFEELQNWSLGKQNADYEMLVRADKEKNIDALNILRRMNSQFGFAFLKANYDVSLEKLSPNSSFKPDVLVRVRKRK